MSRLRGFDPSKDNWCVLVESRMSDGTSPADSCRSMIPEDAHVEKAHKERHADETLTPQSVQDAITSRTRSNWRL